MSRRDRPRTRYAVVAAGASGPHAAATACGSGRHLPDRHGNDRHTGPFVLVGAVRLPATSSVPVRLHPVPPTGHGAGADRTFPRMRAIGPIREVRGQIGFAAFRPAVFDGQVKMPVGGHDGRNALRSSALPRAHRISPCRFACRSAMDLPPSAGVFFREGILDPHLAGPVPLRTAKLASSSRCETRDFRHQ